ncbi:MAG: TrkH family potassium uptake protein [Pseudomonadota bacterium]
MIIPLIVSLIYGEGDARAFAYSIGITEVLSILLFLITRTKKREVSHKEGFIFVAFAWFVAGFFGSLPYFLFNIFPGDSIFMSLTDSIFESISGFTTTGATVISSIENLPHGILFWRSLTHWLGGMGIILLSMCVLPLLGVGGMQLYKAEVPSPVTDKLFPKIADTAKVLWLIYLFLTLAEIVLLSLGGMEIFDSICHTFGTLATGGFSTKNLSIEHYNSAYIHYVIIAFMYLAGVNFSLHFSLLRGSLKPFKNNEEFKFYTGITLFFTLLITISLFTNGIYNSITDSLRYGLFQVLTILTTTGFSTANFEEWSSSAKFILFALMFVGASAGSTGGGIKCLRILLLLKLAYRELKKLIHPHGVFPVKIDNKMVSKDVIESVYGFFFLYFAISMFCALIISFYGIDILSSVSIVAASIGNIGPGFGVIGPHDNYSALPIIVKWISIMCMLLGRLEIYTLILLFIPVYWKK